MPLDCFPPYFARTTSGPLRGLWFRVGFEPTTYNSQSKTLEPTSGFHYTSTDLTGLFKNPWGSIPLVYSTMDELNAQQGFEPCAT